MEQYYRIVLDLYKRSMSNYINNQPVDVNEIFEAQQCINYAIDQAIIHSTPHDDLIKLKEYIDFLKDL